MTFYLLQKQKSNVFSTYIVAKQFKFLQLLIHDICWTWCRTENWADTFMTLKTNNDLKATWPKKDDHKDHVGNVRKG